MGGGGGRSFRVIPLLLPVLFCHLTHVTPLNPNPLPIPHRSRPEVSGVGGAGGGGNVAGIN